MRLSPGVVLLLFLLGSVCAAAQTVVTAEILLRPGGHARTSAAPLATVVWLDPVEVPSEVPPQPPEQGVQLVQRGKQFHPHVLVIPVGTAVEFPNRDPFFHNVFSLFEGKRFDLGLYEAGSSRTVRFDRPGISYIFCNIHSEMNAVVITLATPYHALAGANGKVEINGVRPGRYRLEVWHEGATPQTLKALSRAVVVKGSEVSLGKITVVQDNAVLSHKNKYGQDYEEPSRPAYEQH
jgi:plastocyanin